MNRSIFLIPFLFAHLLTAQTVSIQERFSQHYHTADSLTEANQGQRALAYFDSCRISMADSAEYAYSLVRTARTYDNIGKPDSALIFYSKAESWVRDIGEKEPLSFFLLYRAFHLDRKRENANSKRDLNELLEFVSDDDYQGAYLKSKSFQTLAEFGLKTRKLDSSYYFISKMNEYREKDPTKGIEPHHFNTMAWYYYLTRDLNYALKTLKEYFDWYKVELKDMEPVHSGVVSNIAITYIQLGDFERAEKYQLAILEMLERNDLNKGHTYQQQLGSLANLYITMKRYNEALQLYDRQIEIYKSINSNFRTAYYYESILIEKGQALAGLKRVQESAEIFEEVLNFFERNDADRAVLSNVYLYKGMSELLAEQYQNGLQSLNKTLAIQRANDRARTTDAVPTYSNIAEVYAGLKQFDKAVTYMDSALWINQFNSEFHPDSVGRVGILRWQIEMYNDKLEILKQGWEHEKDNSMLDLAFDVIERGNLTLDYTRKVLVSDESKLRIAEDFYQYAVYFNLQKYNLTNADEYLWKALSFTENNKSFLLNSLTSQRQISKDSEYHKLLDQREEYKQVMSSYAAQDDINNQYIFYAKLDSIQSKVDEFADYKHYREINKEWLSAQFPEASILSAHVSFNSVDFFLVNDAGLNFKQIEIDSAFASDVIALRKSYSSPESKALRLSWFDPLMEWLEPQLSNRLIIIPDGILNYLPFELLTHSASQEQFLLEKTNITYLNYIAQPLRNTSGGRSRANDMISYAPEFYSQSTLASADVVRGDLAGLPGAIEEATLVKDLFKGESFTKQQATETAFKKTSQEIGLIHLATHAIIDDANPNLSRLVFSLENDSLNDGYLHAYEISNLELEAQLVTLSACNTGFGKIKKGEGVMSLSRSFAYAGVPATIVSLWPASDKSTPELMKYFYQNLKDGQAKDVALNNARKQYLETATGKARHPFYWGGFVLIGDNRPLEAPQNNMIWILLLFTAVIVTATVVRRRRQ